MKFIRLAAAVGAALLLCACNAGKGQRESGFKEWAPTPPMGWNSWDCYGPTVVEAEVRSNADFMADNLLEYGWEYVVVDIRWYVENDHAGGYNETDARLVMDGYGRYMPAVNRFPSAEGDRGFSDLAEYIHSKGLKFGIHLMRGIPRLAVERRLPVLGTDGITADMICSKEGTCNWLHDNYSVDAGKPGAQEYYDSVFSLFAEWGLDFIKIDDLSSPYHKDEIELIRKAIDKCGRSIVLSASPGDTPVEAAEHISSHANMWRMVGDVWDLWSDIDYLLDVCGNWTRYIAPGNWPDCDMIPLGHIAIRGERGEDRMTRLTEAEQYTLMSLFCIMKSPLMFGGDLPTSGDFAMSLLTNRDVLRMHAEAEDVHFIRNAGGSVVIASRHPESGEVYLDFINRGDEGDKDISVDLAALGMDGPVKVKDMWSGKVSDADGICSVTLEPHSSALLSISR